MAIQYTSEEKKYVLLKGNILKRMEAERVSDAQMATGRYSHAECISTGTAV